jgi:hypothetical protein
MSGELTALQKTITRGQLFAEKQKGCPVFTWNGTDYPCYSGISYQTFITGVGVNERGQLLSITVRLFDYDKDNYCYTDLWDDDIPQEDDSITFGGLDFRVSNFSWDGGQRDASATFRLKLEQSNKGAAVR